MRQCEETEKILNALQALNYAVVELERLLGHKVNENPINKPPLELDDFDPPPSVA